MSSAWQNAKPGIGHFGPIPAGIFLTPSEELKELDRMRRGDDSG